MAVSPRVREPGHPKPPMPLTVRMRPPAPALPPRTPAYKPRCKGMRAMLLGLGLALGIHSKLKSRAVLRLVFFAPVIIVTVVIG